MTADGVVSGFVANLRRAVRCWRADPRLLVTVLTIWALGVVPIVVARASGANGIGLTGSVVMLATLGFLGAERVWYLAIDEGRRMRGAEVFALSKSLWQRFFGLGVYVMVLMIVPFGLAIGVARADDVAGAVLLFVFAVAFDALLTFATVVLAFWHMTAGDAVRYSWAVTKAQWPRCALYVLAAPLALHLAFLVVPYRDMPTLVYLLVSLAIAVFGLACKGATVFFYADHYLTAQQPSPGSEAERLPPPPPLS